MRERLTASVDAGRIVRTSILCALVIAVCCANSHASGRRHAHRAHRATPKPVATPSALKPVVLIVGGTGFVDRPTGESPGVLNTAEIYDSALHRFLPIAPMNERRDLFAAAALGIDQVLIVGGVNTLLVPLVVFPGPAMPWVMSSAEIFNSSNGKFVSAPNMKSARDEPTATTLKNGKVLIVGGESIVAELYDPASNTFSETGAMASSRHGQTATLLRQGGVLIAGGGFLKAEVYDPADGKFHLAGKLSDNRVYHTATLLMDGRVLIAGGCPFARSGAVDSSEIFDESRRAIRPGPRMNQRRAGHTATLLNDGRVLIAGGRGDNSTEFYDPRSRKFIAGPKMMEARSGHSATLLPDGTVLLAGGWDPDYKPLSSAEIFDPATNRFVSTGAMTEARAGHSAKLIWAREPINWIRPTPSTTPAATPTPTPTPSPTPTETPRPAPSATPSASRGQTSTRTPPDFSFTSIAAPLGDRRSTNETRPSPTLSPSMLSQSNQDGIK